MSDITEEEIARAIFASHAFQPVSGPWVEGSNRVAQQHARDAARAVLAIIQPALERARREVPKGWAMVPVDPKDEHMGENYTDGLWSRRNWEAALEDIAAAIRKG